MNDWRGKWLMLVGGGLLQVPAVHIAQNLGLRVLVTDRDSNCACAQLADHFEALDTKDADGHTVLAHHWRGKLAGVFTEGASVEYTVACAAYAADLPGLAPEVARSIAHKGEMRWILAKAGIPQPQFSMIERDYLEWEYQECRYPCVVKAVDNSASRGMTVCRKPEDFTQAVFDKASTASTTGEVLIEELLVPDPAEGIAEQSCETVWQDGKGYWLGWVDREFAPNQPGLETAVLSPAMHSEATTRATIGMVLAAGRALGMTTGIFKADVMLTKDGPRILETTARLSGGFDAQYLTPLAFGADYIRGAMLLALGEPIRLEHFLPKWHKHAIAKWVFLPKGKLTKLDISAAQRSALVFSRVKVGDIVGEYENCADRSLVVITSGRSRDELRRCAAIAASEIEYEVKQCES